MSWKVSIWCWPMVFMSVDYTAMEALFGTAYRGDGHGELPFSCAYRGVSWTVGTVMFAMPSGPAGRIRVLALERGDGRWIVDKAGRCNGIAGAIDWAGNGFSGSADG